MSCPLHDEKDTQSELGVELLDNVLREEPRGERAPKRFFFLRVKSLQAKGQGLRKRGPEDG